MSSVKGTKRVSGLGLGIDSSSLERPGRQSKKWRNREENGNYHITYSLVAIEYIPHSLLSPNPKPLTLKP